MIGLVQGNALTIPLADGSVQCIVTSPPYWGLRSYSGTATWEGGDLECDHEAARKKNRFDYALQPAAAAHLVARGGAPITYDWICPTCGATRIDAQLGSEPLHDCLGWATGNDCGECYICHMRQVARECWRVLRDDGVMFWNIADSYANQPAGNRTPSGISQNRAAVETLAQFGDNRRGTLAPGLKPKDRCGIPERTALAFQADGWYWRSGITWVKPNPMPESVTDRCTKSTEMIYMFSKNERYYYDTEAVREPNLMSSWSAKADFEGTSKRGMGGIRIEGQKGLDHPGNHELKNSYNPAGRNLRDAWTIATAPYPGQHFATFPPELPRRCIKAGTSERGCCPKCGKPWERIIEKGFTRPSNEQRIAEMIAKGVPRQKANLYTDNGPELARRKAENPDKLLGWRAACACDAGEPVPCIVLDPFSGAGTTILVARELGRHGIGLELSGEYLQQSRDRLGLTALDAWAGGNGRKHETDLTSLPLFGGSDT